jgi:putative phosphoesterase
VFESVKFRIREILISPAGDDRPWLSRSRRGEGAVVRVAVLSDTHSPRYWKACPPAVGRRLERAELILHAGDVCRAETLDELAAFAPVRAVLGNNDGPDVAARGVPERLEFDLDGLPVAMIHDSGPASGRAARLRRLFPGASLVVFGHSHIPWDQTVDGQRAVNPGSPTDKRRQPHGTMGELVIEDGRLVSVAIVPVT